MEDDGVGGAAIESREKRDERRENEALVDELEVVEPEGGADGADVGAAEAAGKLEAEVGRCLVGRAPCYFLDGYDFTFAVEGVFLVVAPLEEVHVGLVKGLGGDVSVVNLKLGSVYPVGVLVEPVYDGSDAVGEDVPVLVFPSALQQKNHTGHVFSWYGLDTAESGLADAVGLVGKLYFVVKLDGLRLVGKRNAVVKFCHGVGAAGDGLKHLAKVDGACCEHMDVDEPEHLDSYDMANEFCALPTTSLFGIDCDICFDDAGNFGHDVAAGPGRAALVGVGLLAVPCACGRDFIKSLCLSSDDGALFDVACNPLVEVGVLQLRLCGSCGG